VVDKEFLAVEFGAAVDERRDAVGDQVSVGALRPPELLGESL